MTPLRQPMRAARQRRGQGERPQPSSVRAVRLLAQGDGTAPALLSAQELPASFLHRTNIAGLAPAAMRLCSRGIRFVSQLVLTRDGQTRSVLRPHTAPRLPAVRRVEEVGRLRKATTPWHHQAACTTVSRVRLRLHAALSLQGSASDGQRLQGPLPRGTGATDRASPLPDETRARRRPAWTTPRHTTWRLPATGRAHPHPPPATSPRRRPRVQGAFRTATPRAGMTTTGVASPPRRQAYAPPRLAAGVPPRLSPRPLGHTPRATTMRAFHLTPPGHAAASVRLHSRRHGLLPCAPAAPSAPPAPQRPWSALPLCPSHTARASAPSHRAQADPRDSASRRAHPVAHTTASITQAATGTGPRARRRHPRRGSTPPGSNRARASPAPSLRPCARGAARLTPAPPRPWARRLPRPSHGARTSSAAAARTGPPSPGSCTPGADRARTTLPSLPSCRVAVVPQTVTRGSPREPPALSPCTPSPPSPARAATQPGATPDGERSATPRAGRAPGTATATPPPPAPRLSQTAPRRSAPWPSPTAAWGAAPTGPSRAPPAHPTGHAHALSPSTPWRCSAGASRTAGPMA